MFVDNILFIQEGISWTVKDFSKNLLDPFILDRKATFLSSDRPWKTDFFSL